MASNLRIPLCILLFFISFSVVNAIPGYNNFLPNGFAIPCPATSVGCMPNSTCLALGHYLTNNASSYCGADIEVENLGNNAFANFNRFEWIKSCVNDSDVDSISDGTEVGDPSCIWTPTNGITLRTMPLTHPGDASAFTAAYKGLGCFKVPGSLTDSGSVPSAPVAFAGFGNPTSVALTWNLYDLSTPCVISYQITANWVTYIVNSDNTTTPVAGTNVTTVKLTNYNNQQSTIMYNLPLQTPITLEIKGINEWGAGPAAIVITVNTTAARTPASPTGFTVNPSALTAAVTWDAPSESGGLEIINYYILLRNATQTVIVGVSAINNTDGTSYTFRNLAIARTYHVRMFAENEEGNGTSTAYFTFSTALTGDSSSLSFLPILLFFVFSMLLI